MSIQPGSETNFVRSLYDFSFTTFITTRIVRVLYIIVTVVYSLFAVISFITLITRGGFYIAVAIVAVPIAYVLYLAFARVILEVIAVVFRIAEYTQEIRDQGRAQMAAGSGWSATGPVGGPAGPPPWTPGGDQPT
jgi:hypothetical protein